MLIRGSGAGGAVFSPLPRLHAAFVCSCVNPQCKSDCCLKRYAGAGANEEGRATMPVQSKCAMCTKALESGGNKVRDEMFSCAGSVLTGVGFHARTKSERSGRTKYGRNLGKGKSRTVIGIEGKSNRQLVSRIVVEVSIGSSKEDDRETGQAVGWVSSVSDAVSAVERILDAPVDLASPRTRNQFRKTWNDAIGKEAARNPIRLEHRAEDGVDEHGNVYRVVSMVEEGEDEEVRGDVRPRKGR